MLSDDNVMQLYPKQTHMYYIQNRGVFINHVHMHVHVQLNRIQPVHIVFSASTYEYVQSS